MTYYVNDVYKRTCKYAEGAAAGKAFRQVGADVAERSTGAVDGRDGDDKTIAIRVVETEPFEKHAKKLLSDAERDEIKVHVAQLRELGPIIRDTGGVRKLRVGGEGKGKRRGHRVIYYYTDDDVPLYLLMIYEKTKKEDLTSADKKACRRFVDELQETLRDPEARRNHLRLVDAMGTKVNVSR